MKTTQFMLAVASALACFGAVSATPSEEEQAQFEEALKLKAPAWHHKRVFIPEHLRLYGEAGESQYQRNAYGGGGATVYIYPARDTWMDAYEVSVGRFAEFVADVGGSTEADIEQRSLAHVQSVPRSKVPEQIASLFLPSGDFTGKRADAVQMISNASWWKPEGAWPVGAPHPKHPECDAAVEAAVDPLGIDVQAVKECMTPRGLALGGQRHFPVRHVAKAEANEYCKWAGGVLPTEEEFEAAAHGKFQDASLPWGNKTKHEGAFRGNLWQGSWPTRDKGLDGFTNVAPISAYGPQNMYGLYNIVGNVNEWIFDVACNISSLHLRRPPLPITCLTTLQQVAQAKAMGIPMPGGEGSDIILEEDVLKLPRSMSLKGEPIAKGGGFASHRNSDSMHRISSRRPLLDDWRQNDIGFRCMYYEPIQGGKECETYEDDTGDCLNVLNTGMQPDPVPQRFYDIYAHDIAKIKAKNKAAMQKQVQAGERLPAIAGPEDDAADSEVEEASFDEPATDATEASETTEPPSQTDVDWDGSTTGTQD